MSTIRVLSVLGMMIAATTFAIAGTTQNVSAVAPGYTQCSPVNTAVSWTPFGGSPFGLRFVQSDSSLQSDRCFRQYQQDVAACNLPTIGEPVGREDCLEAAGEELDRCLDRAFDAFIDELGNQFGVVGFS